MKLLVIFLALFFLNVASSSSISNIDSNQLEKISKYIILATVVSTEETSKKEMYGKQKVEVLVKKTLKGKVLNSKLIVFMGWKGVKDFDPKLSKGQSIVLFLKSIKNNIGQLSYRGAVAIFPKSHIK